MCARVSAGEFDAAIENFRQLVKRDNDVRCMAYIGYCFNLKDVPVAAIPWYELAIANGGASAAVYNNLVRSTLMRPCAYLVPINWIWQSDVFEKQIKWIRRHLLFG